MATIYDVAKLAKVSPKTAARILAGASGRPYNLKRVLAAARKLDYVRDQRAANLRSGKSGFIGVLVPGLSNPVYRSFLQHIGYAILAQGYQILYASTNGYVSDERDALGMFEANRVEGAILNVAEGESDIECDALIERLLRRNIPVVLTGRPARRLKVDELVLRNEAATQKATQYLLKTGHKRIGFLSGQDTMSTRERFEGWSRAMKSAGLTTDGLWFAGGPNNAENGRELTHRVFFDIAVRPTALLASSDMLAIGALKACRELSLRVPEDVAIIGFDDITLAPLMSPPLTTLRQPHQKMASDCVDSLISRIKTGDISEARRFVYEPELIIRESS